MKSNDANMNVSETNQMDQTTIKDLLMPIQDLLPQKYKEISQLPLNEIVHLLRHLRSQIPNQHANLERIDSALLPIFVMERNRIYDHKKSISTEILENTSFIPPQLEDIMLTDVSEKDVRESIAQQLGIIYLATEQKIPTWPVEGIVYGTNKRLFINLLVKWKENDEAQNVIFLVDTGSPSTYLSLNAMKSILPPKPENIPEIIRGYIHNKLHININLSPQQSHFADINVIGTDFMYDHDLDLQVQWRLGSFSLG